jgi:hypothetical protein
MGINIGTAFRTRNVLVIEIPQGNLFVTADAIMVRLTHNIVSIGSLRQQNYAIFVNNILWDVLPAGITEDAAIKSMIDGVTDLIEAMKKKAE